MHTMARIFSQCSHLHGKLTCLRFHSVQFLPKVSYHVSETGKQYSQRKSNFQDEIKWPIFNPSSTGYFRTLFPSILKRLTKWKITKREVDNEDTEVLCSNIKTLPNLATDFNTKYKVIGIFYANYPSIFDKSKYYNLNMFINRSNIENVNELGRSCIKKNSCEFQESGIYLHDFEFKKSYRCSETNSRNGKHSLNPFCYRISERDGVVFLTGSLCSLKCFILRVMNLMLSSKVCKSDLFFTKQCRNIMTTNECFAKDEPMSMSGSSCGKKDNLCKKKKDHCKKKEDPCKKKEDPCKKKEDPCKKKEDPCKKKEDPCKKKEDPCKKKEDPCKKKEDPCKKKEDPCKKKEDPCKKKQDPCKKKEDPCKKKEDPCKKKEDPCIKKIDLCVKKKDKCSEKKVVCGKKKEPCGKKKEDPCGKKEHSCKKDNCECNRNDIGEIKRDITEIKKVIIEIKKEICQKERQKTPCVKKKC